MDFRDSYRKFGLYGHVLGDWIRVGFDDMCNKLAATHAALFSTQRVSACLMCFSETECPPPEVCYLLDEMVK